MKDKNIEFYKYGLYEDIRGYGMNKKNISIALFPTIIMILICFIEKSSIFKFSPMDLKGLLIVSVVLIFPIIFLIQGIIATANNTNKIVSLGVSLISYLVYLVRIMKEAALMYIVFYFVWYVLGIFVGTLIRKYSGKFKIK